MNLRPLALIVLGLVSACRERVRGSGHVVTISPAVSGPFTRVAVRGGMHAVVTVGSPVSVRLRGDDNVLPLVRVSVRDDALTIEPLPGQRLTPSTPVTAEVTTPNLRGVEASGGSDITASGVAARGFRVDLSGGSRAAVSGATDTLDVDASGGARLDADGLTAHGVTISASGGVSATVRATASLTGDLSGGVNLRVTGSPTSRSVQTSGGARVSYP